MQNAAGRGVTLFARLHCIWDPVSCDAFNGDATRQEEASANSVQRVAHTRHRPLLT